MVEEELMAMLRLKSLPKIGDITAKKLIARCGNAVQVFMEKRANLLKIEGIGAAIIQDFHDGYYAQQAETELGFIKKNNLEVINYLDPTYPNNLKHCVDSPILLFKRGQMDWSNPRILSIVGTRNITSAGVAFCQRFVEEISPLDPIIVSGFAYGVDITAQAAAMDCGLQTIACLAHGLNQIYPKAHSKYQKAIESHGGFLTEFWSTSQPERENFLRRNRIIAGISVATLVVESAEKGGSLVTADLALNYNREVFAVPGRPTDKQSVGCNNLIKHHRAQLVTSAADVAYHLGWQVEEEKAPKQTTLFALLDPDEQKVYDYLQLQGKQLLDFIARDCDIPVYKLTSILLGMEMKEVVRPLPGKLFEAI